MSQRFYVRKRLKLFPSRKSDFQVPKVTSLAMAGPLKTLVDLKLTRVYNNHAKFVFFTA